MSTTTVPRELAGLVDDAAPFPPASVPLAAAVRAHRTHRAAPYAELVGPFVVADSRLPELVELLSSDAVDAEPAGRLPVSVVVSGGAGGLEPAARWADRSPLLELRSLELALRDLDDLSGSARRVAAAAAAVEPAAVYVEPPPSGARPAAAWCAALDEVAAAGLRLKLRTGGESAVHFPTEEAVAAFVDAALDRELPFKCTAGLHHAVRHRAAGTGFEHHGFLNILLATRAALDGDDVVAVLAERDPAALSARLAGAGSDALVRARQWFTSFGCCEVLDPVHDLRELELLGG